MITGRQIRAARALLKWDAEELATQAGLNRDTVFNIEKGLVQARGGSLEKIVEAFTDHGVEFVGERGVTLRDDQVITITGENIFFGVLDDVIGTLRRVKGAEALFACVSDKLSPPVVVENYRRLRSSGIAMRSLVKEGDTWLMGKLKEYRYLPARFFHNNATVIYGDRFATMILDPKTGADIGAVIIRNPHVAAAQRNLFNFIWSAAAAPRASTAEVRYDG
jgi:DNA-binding XRE family transcriptional regulator